MLSYMLGLAGLPVKKGHGKEGRSSPIFNIMAKKKLGGASLNLPKRQ